MVKESDARQVTLPGRVTFDEDHTQRVASPIDGRVVAILVKLGDKVSAGQPLFELSSPNVGQLQADAQKAMSDLASPRRRSSACTSCRRGRGVREGRRAGRGRLQEGQVGLRARTTAQLKSLGVSPSDPAVKVALRAQIAGVVVERNVLVGQEVRAIGRRR